MACVGCHSFWHYDPSEPSGRFGCVIKAATGALHTFKIRQGYLSFFLCSDPFQEGFDDVENSLANLFFSPILGFMLRVCWCATQRLALRLEASKDLQNEVEDLQSLGWKLIPWRCLR